jgi:hypothetical protein
MTAGAPVRKRENGFSSDMNALGRLRIALKIDSRLPPDLVARAIAPLDSLMEALGELHKTIVVDDSLKTA